MKKSVSIILSGLFLQSLAGCGATAQNNDGFLMTTSGNYQAQDTDTEQNGQQEFEGQLDYMQDQQEQQQQNQQVGNQISNQMSQEYQQQIQQQQNSGQ